MRKKLLAMTALLASTGAVAGGDVHWSYSGAEGPEYWGTLSPAFSACAEGRNQSPVDLHGFVEADLKPIGFDYKPGLSGIVNNGHTVKLDVRPGSTIEVDGHRFELKQFHFHAPSENRIDGKAYPLEAHLVHADEAGNLVVVAVMFEQGEANAALGKAWKHMPEKAGKSEKRAMPISAEAILPKERDYYRFNGSLTTPPCSEGVVWLVMKQPISASAEQIEKFKHAMHHDNNRPVQPLHARAVMQ
jgi:carbonic anhydrase